MNLKQIANKFGSTKIEGLEDIARRVSAGRQSEFDFKYAREIVRQKVENSGINFKKNPFGDFPYTVSGRYLVGFSSGKVVPDLRKTNVERYCKKLKRNIGKFDGLVYFMPVQMNGGNVKKIIERQVPVVVVNLSYDEKSLERRFRNYCC